MVVNISVVSNFLVTWEHFGGILGPH